MKGKHKYISLKQYVKLITYRRDNLMLVYANQTFLKEFAFYLKNKA